LNLRRPLIATLLVVGLTIPLAIASGCGEKSESLSGTVATHDFNLALDWFPNPDHVAIYEAEKEGYFDDVGLRVKAHVPSDPAAPIKQVAAGRVDLAISYEPEVFLARQQGLPVVAVAALVQRPLTSLMAIARKKIRSAHDLAGKRVGTAGIPYQSAYLKTILERAGVKRSSVKETNVGASLLPAMLSGKVDATLGAFWNVEGVELELRAGIKACQSAGGCGRSARAAEKAPTIVPVDRLGVPDYDELVLVANSDKLDDKRDDLRLFIGAVARGAREARRDPRGSASALLEANRDLKSRAAREGVRVTLPALFPEQTGKPWGYLDPNKWRVYGSWMFGNGLLEQRPQAADVLTNDLLPGEGL
jgi:putative hydroxymethylpyrimidine transport system substrate-binding protein